MTLYKAVADLNGGSQVAMTADEEAAFISAQSSGAAIAAVSLLKSQAQSALTESDKTILRCYENAVAVPSSWATYRSSLRAIVSSGSGSIPTKPSYPAGT